MIGAVWEFNASPCMLLISSHSVQVSFRVLIAQSDPRSINITRVLAKLAFRLQVVDRIKTGQTRILVHAAQGVATNYR